MSSLIKQKVVWLIMRTPIKITVSSHLTPVRMASITKSTNSKCRRERGEKGSLCAAGGDAEGSGPSGKRLEAPQKPQRDLHTDTWLSPPRKEPEREQVLLWLAE